MMGRKVRVGRRLAGDGWTPAATRQGDGSGDWERAEEQGGGRGGWGSGEASPPLKGPFGSPLPRQDPSPFPWSAASAGDHEGNPRSVLGAINPGPRGNSAFPPSEPRGKHPLRCPVDSWFLSPPHARSLARSGRLSLQRRLGLLLPSPQPRAAPPGFSASFSASVSNTTSRPLRILNPSAASSPSASGFRRMQTALARFGCLWSEGGGVRHRWCGKWEVLDLVAAATSIPHLPEIEDSLLNFG